MSDPDSGPTDPEAVLEELAGLPTLAHPTASPDGSEVACYYDVSGRNELHVLDVEAGTYEGSLYAAPYYAGGRIVFYSPMMVDEVPATLDEYVAEGVAMTTQSNSPIRAFQSCAPMIP